MGNCCAATPTTDSHVFSADERENPIPRTSPHGIGVAGQQRAPTTTTAGHVTPDSLPEVSVPPAEPQQLEHIADREGQSSTFGDQTCFPGVFASQEFKDKLHPSVWNTIYTRGG